MKKMQAYFNGKKKELDKQIFYDLWIDPERTAIITVDMHEGHLSDDPDCPCPAPRGNQIVGPINEFNDKARALGMPVIHVVSQLRADGSDDIKGNISAWRLLFQEAVGEIPGIDQHALEGTKWVELSLEMKEEDYLVNTKKRLSAFYPSDLELLLRNLRKDIIVLVGAMTDCCILNTASDGANRDFRVIVPQDLTRGSEHLEAPALEIISGVFGLVVDSEDLLEQWNG